MREEEKKDGGVSGWKAPANEIHQITSFLSLCLDGKFFQPPLTHKVLFFYNIAYFVFNTTVFFTVHAYII